jgi:hypothetical protein
MGAPLTRRIAAALIASVAMSLCFGLRAQGVQRGKLPATTTESLAERPLILPRELPAERTLVLIAFERDQRAALATWKSGLDLATGKTPWVELIVAGPQNAFVHAMILRGLRRENAEGPARDRIVPIFMDQEPYAATLGVSAKNACALIVDRAGSVLALAEGDYSPSKAQPLLLSLKP